MPGLLMFYVGGTAPGANIELHDVQFAADRPDEAYPLLREKWFGDKRKVHVDGYARIDWADGYDVSLEPAPFAGEEKLFFVNVGGYRSDELAELHQFGLFVARSADEAKEKAKRVLLTDSAQQHKDDRRGGGRLPAAGAAGLPRASAGQPAWQTGPAAVAGVSADRRTRAITPPAPAAVAATSGRPLAGRSCGAGRF